MVLSSVPLVVTSLTEGIRETETSSNSILTPLKVLALSKRKFSPSAKVEGVAKSKESSCHSPIGRETVLVNTDPAPYVRMKG